MPLCFRRPGGGSVGLEDPPPKKGYFIDKQSGEFAVCVHSPLLLGLAPLYFMTMLILYVECNFQHSNDTKQIAN